MYVYFSSDFGGQKIVWKLTNFEAHKEDYDSLVCTRRKFECK